MRMVKNIFIGLLLAWFFLLAFMPKEELYYKLEETLAQNDIKINEKHMESGIFSLTLYEVDIYIKGIKLVTIEEIDFFTLLFYTSVDIDKLLLDDSLKSMAPTHIEMATLTHNVMAPTEIEMVGEGTFGSLEGIINLNENSVRVDFNNSKGIEDFKPKLQEDEKGWYYETSF